MTMNSRKGSTLIEVVVASSILSVVCLTFLGVFSVLSHFHQKNMYSIKGGLLSEEGVEALRLMKSEDWNVLASVPAGEARYFALGTSTWSATSTPEIVDGAFYRTFRIYAVSRDESDDIVASGGTVDPNTLLVESSVSWNWRGATTTTAYKAYFTNI
jgi:Tfp pilus assembly protein PilV